MDNGYDHINTSWHNIIKWIFMILFSDPNRLNYVWLLSCFNYLSHYCDIISLLGSKDHASREITPKSRNTYHPLIDQGLTY